MEDWEDAWLNGREMPEHGFPRHLIPLVQETAENWLLDKRFNCIVEEWVSAKKAEEVLGCLLWSGFCLLRSEYAQCQSSSSSYTSLRVQQTSKRYPSILMGNESRHHAPRDERKNKGLITTERDGYFRFGVICTICLPKLYVNGVVRFNSTGIVYKKHPEVRLVRHAPNREKIMPNHDQHQICATLIDKLSKGEPLDPSEKTHLVECEECMSDVVRHLAQRLIPKNREDLEALLQTRPEAKKALEHGKRVLAREFGL